LNVYKLEAAIGLNSTEYQKGLKAAGESMSAMGDKIKAGAAAIGKATAAGMAAGAAGVTALAKSAVAAYADYEQLVGGVEKLFGESSDLLMMYAKEAANTAGMSYNQYMETATSFAAALTTSVQAAGGSMDEAVELADTAMRDMSDNANVFGSDLSSIQAAYQGFAKGQYQLLDNLKLGYSGTKTEMERLIEDANELRHAQGINNDLTIESYADVITAIHEVQTNMNITGTTAREASKTISGSIGAVKAAWTNLTIEMAKDDGDIDGAFQVLGENVGAVVDNMLPRVEKAIGGIGTMISKAAPQITNGLKQLLPRVLPTLLSTAGTLVSSVSTAVMESLPELMDIGGGLIDSFAGNSKYIFQSAQKMISNFADQLLNVDYGKLGNNISTIFANAINSITDFVKSIDFYKVGENIADFLNNIDWQMVANSLFDLIAAGIKAIPDIAVSFFAKADLGNLMTMIGLMGAPKLLGGITDFTGGEEGQALGKAAGQSWSGAFMAGVKAFGLGWALGSYIRDELVDKYGEEKVNDVIGGGAFGVLGLSQEMKIAQEKANSYTYTNRYGQKVTIPMYDEHANYTEAYKKVAMQGPRKPENNAIGNYITQPTLTWAAEKEPEYIIPESKMDKVFSREGVTININVSGADLVASDTVAQKIAETLANLSIRQQRAVGGTAW
jgi:hypothetical protein